MNKLFIYIIFIFITTTACEEVRDIPLKNQETGRLAVDGRFTNEKKVHQVYLKRSTEYYNNVPAPGVSGAVVTISSDTEFYSLSENPETPGLYETKDNVGGRIGQAYTLDILTGDEHYSSTVKMDTIMSIDSITYEYEYEEDYDFGYYLLKLYAQELQQEGNGYLFNIYMNDVWDNDTLDETPYFSDEEPLNGYYLPGINIYMFEQEQITEDTNHILVEMLSIDEEEYEYINTLLIETDFNTDLIGSIFSGSPSNVPTNIVSLSGGLEPLGFFSVASVVSYDLVLYKEHSDDP